MRVLLADGQSDVRSALRLLLEEEDDVEVVGEAVAAPGLLKAAEDTEPDVIMLQWELPQACGQWVAPGGQYGLIESLRRALPRLAVVVFSGWPDARRAAILAGANGFISICDRPENLLTTLRAASAGGMK